MNMMMQQSPLLAALYGMHMQSQAQPQFNYNPQIADPHDQMNSTGVPYQRPNGPEGLPLPSDPSNVQGPPRRQQGGTVPNDRQPPATPQAPPQFNPLNPGIPQGSMNLGRPYQNFMPGPSLLQLPRVRTSFAGQPGGNR